MEKQKDGDEQREKWRMKQSSAVKTRSIFFSLQSGKKGTSVHLILGE